MKRINLILILMVSSQMLFGQKYEWRGPARDGKFIESELLKTWPDEGPEKIFSKEGIGKGYSSPIVTEDHIFITGMKDSVDYLSSLTLRGELLWQVPYGKSWDRSFPDTRSSPTIDEDRVYVLSGSGVLSCLKYSDGSLIWKVNVDKDFESERHVWGVSETPLIIDDMVICTPGGSKTSVIALDKFTGDLVWESESMESQRSYASPMIYELNEQKYILAVTARHLMSLSPKTGEIIWSFNYFNVKEWKSQPGLIWANSPVFSGNQIYITKGYDHPGVMLEVSDDGKSVSEKFRTDIFDNHHHGLILHNGYLYGSNWESNSKGYWVCMDWSTGEVKYEHNWISKGSMVFADGMLYAYVEKNGAVGLIKPDPEKFDLVSSFRVREGTGPHWAHPFIKNKKLYLRHGDVLMAYDIAAD